MLIEFSLRLNFTGRRDTTRSVMADWIKKAKYQWDEDQRQQDRRAKIFGPKAVRLWESLVAQIKADVNELNATCEPVMKGLIEINNRRVNGRRMIPDEAELHLDKLGTPEICLTVQLDIAATSIKVSRRIKPTVERDIVESSDRIDLQLGNDDEVRMLQPSAYGEAAQSIEHASQRILSIFIKSPNQPA